ncbi:hypothetical protein DXG01_010022 [Tephrocybe rancida]|nr:hypothetical protein DXG01_010022 [Tephrocybe rancida]
MSYDSDLSDFGGNPAPEGNGGEYALEGGPGSPTEQLFIFKRKKALLVAVTYKGEPEHALNTLDDLETFKNFLIDWRGYNENEITVLSDGDDTPEHLKPYKENIIREMENLYEDQEDGDHYVFYSEISIEPVAGHAFQTPAISDTKEEDDQDENMAVLVHDWETPPSNQDGVPHMPVIDNVSMRSTDT